ncbi:hypothetical protein LOD99_1149 [Oopsacas minuta]|uniref:Uncharacterized protein n=1 Tax=Oopsacas minuta TaxID=111878 RepID=A0AAV7K6U3_9METZ|nr:hypothetical protein LOD99_1149 [Oopsacas minuta]
MQSRYTGEYNHVPFLTPSQVQERLQQYEIEFSDRYSKKDDYYRYANRVKKTPVPVIKPWPPSSYARFNYRKEAMLHRHRNVQKPNRSRGTYHRNVHSRLGRLGKSTQGNKRNFHHGSSPSFMYPSVPLFPGEVLDVYNSQEVLMGAEIELEVSDGEEGTRDLTRDNSSPCPSDEPVVSESLPLPPSPLSQHSSSSHDNQQASLSPSCDPQQRSPFSPCTLTGSDTPGDSAKPINTRISPTPSASCTPESVFPSSGLKTDQQGTKRVNLANLSSIQSANGRKKQARSSSSKLFSNILASTDYSLDRPKHNFSHGQKTSVSDTRPLDTLPVSIPLDKVRLPAPRSRSLSKRQKKEPIAPVRIKLNGQTWQLECASKI